MVSNISSGMGFGLRRPGTKQAQSVNPQDVTTGAAGLAAKAAKAGKVKSVKLKIKMKGK